MNPCRVPAQPVGKTSATLSPKFSEAVVSCDRVSHRILITGTEPWATGVNPDADMWINQASDGKKSSERSANYQNYVSGYKGGTSS
jgi:hypothetical protein